MGNRCVLRCWTTLEIIHNFNYLLRASESLYKKFLETIMKIFRYGYQTIAFKHRSSKCPNDKSSQIDFIALFYFCFLGFPNAPNWSSVPAKPLINFVNTSNFKTPLRKHIPETLHRVRVRERKIDLSKMLGRNLLLGCRTLLHVSPARGRRN